MHKASVAWWKETDGTGPVQMTKTSWQVHVLVLRGCGGGVCHQ